MAGTWGTAKWPNVISPEVKAVSRAAQRPAVGPPRAPPRRKTHTTTKTPKTTLGSRARMRALAKKPASSFRSASAIRDAVENLTCGASAPRIM
jgi:hypothetical protein